MKNENPLKSFLATRGFLILDGGLATELETRGYDLADELWSAKILLEDPDAIKQVHIDYLTAGADCIISASYQGTIDGFIKKGLSLSEAEAMLRRSVELADEARNEFWANAENRLGRIRPIIAASVGPYGAAMADGSEYTGDYDLDEKGLLDFHSQRWKILAGTPADLLACETIPSFNEARVLAGLLSATPERYAWFSFSCRDGSHISDGTPLVDCLKPLADHPQIVAVGINCTAPRFVPQLIRQARRAVEKPIIVYPNSGERYDSVSQGWTGIVDEGEFAHSSVEWRAAGASLIGGCCRTGPRHIKGIRQQLGA